MLLQRAGLLSRAFSLSQQNVGVNGGEIFCMFASDVGLPGEQFCFFSPWVSQQVGDTSTGTSAGKE